jgi:hypothetical protein
MTGSSSRFLYVAAGMTSAAALLLGSPPSAAATASSTLDASAAASAATGSYLEIKWTDLIPKDWNAAAYMPSRRLGLMSDLAPDAQAAFAQMRLAWDNAPTVVSMEGAQVKLPGYLVPLEEARGEMTEFLLVPYFGACIHTPPPPANQIVFVRLKTPIQGFHSMDTVWVQGQLTTTRQASYMGASGYKIDAVSVDRYVAPTR